MKAYTWERARNPEQKEIRINEILKASDKVFKTTAYNLVTMNLIAKQANISRSNLYKYFESREEIFLSLFFEDVNAWVDDLQNHITKKMTVNTLIKTWTTILCRQHRLLKLGPLVTTSLEANTSTKLMSKMSSVWGESLVTIINLLHKALPQYSIEQFQDYMLFHMVLLTGAIPMSERAIHLSPKKNQDYTQQAKFVFEEFYKKNMTIYFKGIEKI